MKKLIYILLFTVGTMYAQVPITYNGKALGHNGVYGLRGDSTLLPPEPSRPELPIPEPPPTSGRVYMQPWVPYGNSWYVDDGGSDSNDGTSVGQSFATFAEAFTHVSKGDIIYVGPGTYSEEVTFTSDSIIIQGYKTTPGDQPKEDWTFGDVLDPSEMPLFDFGDREHDVAFDTNNKRGNQIKNIQITECKQGIDITGRYNYVENVYGHTLGSIADGTGSDGIVIPGSKYLKWKGGAPPNRTSVPSGAGSVVRNCLLVDCAGIAYASWSDSTVFVSCEMYQNTGPTHAEAVDYYFVLLGSYSVFDSSYAWRNTSIDHGGHGFGVKGSWLFDPITDEPIDAQYDTIRNCLTRGMRLESFWARHREVHDIYFANNRCVGDRQGFVVGDSSYNNTFYNCWADSMLNSDDQCAGIVLRDGSEDGGQNNTGCNNTFNYFKCTNSYTGIAITPNYSGSECNDNVIQNATFYNLTNLMNIQGVNSGCSMTNIIVEDVDNMYDNLDYTDNWNITYADWYNIGFTAPSGTGNITTDPDMVDPVNGDFTLSPGSDAIDAGIDVGLPYNGIAPDMGAHESE